jgi:hypothetical protein
MFLHDMKKTLHSIGSARSTRWSREPQSTSRYTRFSEPSPEIRAVVRKHRSGLPGHPPVETGQIWTGPAAYEAHPIHKRAEARSGLASSDALIITRFLLTGADDSMVQFLKAPTEGRTVLDFDLGGLELAWHSDLMRVLEERVAMWSVLRLVLPSGDLILEHIVMPWRTEEGHSTLVGWYHRAGGSFAGDPDWSNVTDVARERRRQRISGFLPDAALRDPCGPDPE